MLKQWLLAIPLVLASTIAIPAQAASIRDEAGMFSREAVSQATARLGQVERESGMRITIETIDSLDNRSAYDVANAHARRSRTEGIYVLIAEKEHEIEALASPAFEGAISAPRRLRIQQAFAAKMKQRDRDGALLASAEAIQQQVSQAKAANGGNLRSGAVPAGRHGARRGSGLGSLLTIGLLIIGGLFLIRLLGGLFGANRGYGAPGMMGRPGYGPGYGGYGGGGGFWSSMFGGIGGALAGNWLYDQFSGRHHGGYTDSSSYGDAGTSGDGGGDWAGGEATDWGGGDGGGGDWGGGGGDWGGGGGDGGGGDW